MYRAPKIRTPGKHLKSEKEEEQSAKQHMLKEGRKKKVNGEEAQGRNTTM